MEIDDNEIIFLKSLDKVIVQNCIFSRIVFKDKGKIKILIENEGIFKEYIVGVKKMILEERFQM